MLFFLLAVVFTVMLYLIMRAYPRYQVDSFHAVVFNYYSCVLTGPRTHARPGYIQANGVGLRGDAAHHGARGDVRYGVHAYRAYRAKSECDGDVAGW